MTTSPTKGTNVKLSIDDLLLAYASLEESANLCLLAVNSPNMPQEALDFMRERHEKKVRLADRLYQEADRTSAPVDMQALLQPFVGDSVLDWHDDRIFALTLAQLRQIVEEVTK